MASRLWTRSDLNKLSKGKLAAMLVEGIPKADGGWLANAGPVSAVMFWRKDEIISDFLDMQERAK